VRALLTDRMLLESAGKVYRTRKGYMAAMDRGRLQTCDGCQGRVRVMEILRRASR
jgi:hypothetical protein